MLKEVGEKAKLVEDFAWGMFIDSPLGGNPMQFQSISDAQNQ